MVAGGGDCREVPQRRLQILLPLHHLSDQHACETAKAHKIRREWGEGGDGGVRHGREETGVGLLHEGVACALERVNELTLLLGLCLCLCIKRKLAYLQTQRSVQTPQIQI